MIRLYRNRGGAYHTPLPAPALACVSNVAGVEGWRKLDRPR
ncbi:hypothetical protein [Rhizobium lusitanum]|nr:hypothetical protein [Rhizobium lusitanum]